MILQLIINTHENFLIKIYKLIFDKNIQTHPSAQLIIRFVFIIR
jgi:hypothetical protein